ncbi:MAG: class I SAM-dependent methyltransferase [Pseudonocardia sp.]
MTEMFTSWVREGPITSPFAHPRGLRGRLAGRFMAVTNGRASREVAALLPLRAGQTVLEVGYGPGVLLGALLARPERPRLLGVDPSEEMCRLAARRAPGADLRLGDAAATGLDDAAVDHVVSVNTVAIWPDLDAGLDELCRVLRPGGTLLLAWHSATARSRISRTLGLPAAALARIEAGLSARCRSVDQVVLTDVLVFHALR